MHRAALTAGLLFVLSLGTLAQTVPQPVPDAADASVPDQWFGPGPLHKLIVDATEAGLADGLRGMGAVRQEVDYGAFSLLVVDERVFGGHDALESAGFAFNDEHDVIPVNGYRLDGTRPAETLAQLQADE